MPKAMVPFSGRPFIEHVIEMLRDEGFDHVLLLLGYLPDAFIDHFGDGSGLGIRVTYDVTDPDDLTSQRVLHAAARGLLDETFLLLYCDNYWPMRWDDMWRQYLTSGKPVQITVYANDDGYTRDSVVMAPGNTVAVFDRTRATPGLKGVEISYAIVRRDVLLAHVPVEPAPVEDAYAELARRGELGAYWTNHRYYSVGGHDRLPLTQEFFRRRPTVILDRDGVLNERPPRAEYVRSPDAFVWLPGALEALRLLHVAGHRTIVVSNQAGVNRGVMTEGDVARVHARMQADAERAGGRIDAVYHCPHDWDEGCECRKPRPGMLFAAQRDFSLDLTRTPMIGDDERDGEAARAAGCPFLVVDDHRSLLDHVTRLVEQRSVTAPT